MASTDMLVAKADLAPPADISEPSTPQNKHASLPPKIPRRESNSPSIAEAAIFFRNQSENGSPPPVLPSSMTPPPSTQVPQRDSSASLSPVNHNDSAVLLGNPTPPVSTLLTPGTSYQPRGMPPIVNGKFQRHGAQRDDNTLYKRPTPVQLASASPTELQNLLRLATANIDQLQSALLESNASAAHYKLQHKLLTIETEDAAKRMEVEHEMTRREVEVLRYKQHQAGEAQHAANRAHVQQIDAGLERHCNELEELLELNQNRLRKAKKVIQQRDGQILMLNEKIDMLVNRIRTNREHFNQLLGPNGMYNPNTPRQTDTAPVTPQRKVQKQSVDPKRLSNPRDGRQDTFAALLLADQVLSQETTSAPSTPIRSRPAKQRYHSRDHHSLSSLQSTPRRSHQNTTGSTTLLPPLVMTTPPPSTRKPQTTDRVTDMGRRDSRDSTISASEKGDDSSDDDVHAIAEPAASRLATSMLRRSPGQSIEVVGTPSPMGTGTLQGKFFSRIGKTNPDSPPFVEGLLKRKVDGPLEGRGKDVKRTKMIEAVGLGIGAWGSPSI